MTDDEKKEIVAEVIQTLKTNAVTVDQLNEVLAYTDDDYVELNKGRKMKVKKIEENIASGIDNKYGVTIQNLETKDDEIEAYSKKITTEYNVSTFHPTSGTDGSNRYDLAGAIAQVPAELRTAGLTVSFLNESGDTEKWEFSGGSWAVGGFSQVGSSKFAELEGEMGYNGVISVNDEYRYAAKCIRKIVAFTDVEEDVELYVLKYDESTNKLTINIKNSSTKSQIGYFVVAFDEKPTGIVSLICEPHQYYPNCALYAVIDFSLQKNVQTDNCHIVIEKMPKNSSAYFSLFEAKEQVEKHDEIINVVTDRLGISDTNVIDGWGDSLTAGSGGGGVTYLTKLQELVGDGYVVKNYGHGGETAAAIAFRQGGLKILLDPFSIVNGGQGTCTFKAINGMSLKTLYSNANGTQGIDNIYVGDKKLMFRTTANANECTLYNNKGAGDLSYDRPVMARAEGGGINHILIISMGQNGTADGIVDTDYRKLIGLYKLMISYNNYDKYIVAGIPTNDKERWGELEMLLGTEFGDHFFNSRDYISKYGLEDNNLEPTEQDLEAMEIGAIPPSLLSNYPTDPTHMNSYGYSSWGIGLYNRGKELGYW